MNQEQAKSIARWLISSFGGILIGWATSRGFGVDGLSQIFGSEFFIGLVASLISIAWSMVAKTPIGLILAAANMIQVKEIKVADPGLAAQLRGKSAEAVFTAK